MTGDRDVRLRERARETIRYELEGAAKDGVTPNDDWEELVHGRDVLALLRERDVLRERVNDLEAGLRGMLELNGYRPRDGSVNPEWESAIIADARAVLSRPATDKEPGA